MRVIDPIVLDDQLTTKLYVDGAISAAMVGLDWQESVLDKDLTAPPGGESAGDRYIVASVASGDWTGKEKDIAEAKVNNPSSPSDWRFITPNEGFALTVEDEDAVYYYNNAGNWVKFGSIINHANLLNLLWSTSGHTIDADVDMNGNNLTEVGSVVGAAPDAKVESTTGDVILKVGDNAGVKGVNVKDSDDATVFFIDSNGNVTIGQAVLKGTSFPGTPSDGDLFNRTDLDMVFRYDGGRTKWLSEHSEMFNCGRAVVPANVDAYAKVGDGTMSSTSGLRMPRDGTIVAVTLQNNNSVTRTIDFRVNNSAVNRVQLALTAATGGKVTNADQDFSADDLIQVLALIAAGNAMADIISTIEVKWRA